MDYAACDVSPGAYHDILNRATIPSAGHSLLAEFDQSGSA